jgi:hypothetical protein
MCTVYTTIQKKVYQNEAEGINQQAETLFKDSSYLYGFNIMQGVPNNY